MVVHDYICFIERNGQDLYGLQYEGDYNKFHAVIVMVPKIYSKAEILSWKLSEFSKYPIKRYQYSWDNRDFTRLSSYSDALWSCNSWWDQTIWTAPELPNMYLVNFDPGAYDAFVLEKSTPESISLDYYQRVLSNRYLDMPHDKITAYNFIMNCGIENLAEYHRTKPPSIDIPDAYTSLYKSVMSLPLFSNKFCYKLEVSLPELHYSRLAVLIGDNVKCKNNIMRPGVSYCVTPYVSKNKYIFTYIPTIDVKIPDILLKGCLICGKRRCRTKYTCVDHYDSNIDIDMHNGKIADVASDLINNLNILADQKLPDTLFAEFTEKGITYNLSLKLSN